MFINHRFNYYQTILENRESNRICDIRSLFFINQLVWKRSFAH